MNVEQIQQAVNELQKALAAKGKHGADADFRIEAHADHVATLEWRKPNAIHTYDKEYEWIRGNNPDELITKARQFIYDLPSAEETKFREFMGALGNVIELGRTNGIDVDFINPLTETMKRLSENALTDLREAA